MGRTRNRLNVDRSGTSKRSLNALSNEKSVAPASRKTKSSITITDKRRATEDIESSREKKQKLDRGTSQQCSSILKALMNHRFGRVFNHPVDPVALGIPDYFSVITDPMDLGTIKSKLESNLYQASEELAADVRLTFSNAMRYNPPGNDVHKVAKELLEVFEKKWRLPKEKWVSGRSYSQPELSIRPAAEKISPTLSSHISLLNKKSTRSKRSVSKRSSTVNGAEIDHAKTLPTCAPKSPRKNLHTGTETGKHMCTECGSMPCQCSSSSNFGHSSSGDQSNERLLSGEKPDVKELCRLNSQTRSLSASQTSKSDSDSDSDGVRSVSEDEREHRFDQSLTPVANATSEACSSLSPKNDICAAMLKIRCAETILKAQQKTLLDFVDKVDQLTMQQEEKEMLERRQHEEREQREAHIKAAGMALRLKAGAEKKQQQQSDGEAACMALQKIERTVAHEILKELKSSVEDSIRPTSPFYGEEANSYAMELASDEDLELGSNDVEESLNNRSMELKQDETLSQKKRRARGPTVMRDVTKLMSAGKKRVVEYNDDGVPIGVNGHKLRSFIGTCVHHHVPITYTSWTRVPAELKEKIYNMVESAFIIDGRSKKAIIRSASITFRQFKSRLTTEFVLPFKDEPQLLLDPPLAYSRMIERHHWEEFVKSRLSEEFQNARKKQQERRKKNKYNHRMSRGGYANLAEKMKKSNENDFGRANMWKKARMNKNGEYDNEVQQVVHRIDEILENANPFANKNVSPNDVLTQALGTPEKTGRVRGVGAFVTPSIYFHTVKRRSKQEEDLEKKIVEENEALRKRIKELEDQIQNTSEHDSCSKIKIQVTQKSNVGVKEIVSAPITHVAKEKEKVLMKLAKEEEIISIPPKKKVPKKAVMEKEVIISSVPLISHDAKKNGTQDFEILKEKTSTTIAKEKEVTSASSNLSISLKSILRYAEKVMVDGTSISLELPVELFGICRKSYVLREDIIEFCSMQKVKTLSMVAYIAYLHSFMVESNKESKYIFVDPSLISEGQNTREIRARNLCSRLMASNQDQLVIVPYNSGDHWSLIVINAYDDVVYYFDSLRTSSRKYIKYITIIAMMIFRAQKNLKETRKKTLWTKVMCPLQVGTIECGYYVMRYMRDIVTKDKGILDVIDTRSSYSQHDLDEVRVEWAEFLGRYI